MKCNSVLTIIAILLLASCGDSNQKSVSRTIDKDSLVGMWVHYIYQLKNNDKNATTEYKDLTYYTQMYRYEHYHVKNFGIDSIGNLSYHTTMKNMYRCLYANPEVLWSDTKSYDGEWKIVGDTLIEIRNGNSEISHKDGKAPNWYNMPLTDESLAGTYKYKIAKITKNTLILEDGEWRDTLVRINKVSDIEQMRKKKIDKMKEISATIAEYRFTIRTQ